MKERETLKLALEALKEADKLCPVNSHAEIFVREAINAIKEALAQQSNEQVEPVATMWQHGETGRTRITTPDRITDCDARWFKVSDLYTTPPQRKPLTDEQICPWFQENTALTNEAAMRITRAIEAAHGIKE